MFCDAVLEVVEPIAGGDLTIGTEVAAHLATCTGCRTALERARAIDRALQARAVPAAPAEFSSRALARIRRDRWRRDQRLDLVFNTILVLVIVAIVVGLWLIMSRSGLVIVSDEAMGLIETGVARAFRRIAPQVPLYAAAAGLLAGAIGLWWWAERDESLQ